MERHPSLQDLSRDHYFTLVQAQRLKRAEQATVHTVAAEFLRFWRDQMVHHFRQEEEILLPVFVRYRPADDPAVVTVLVQHVEIARRVIDLSAREGLPDRVAVAHDLGELIDQHIRHEERVLFPAIEAVLPEQELAEFPARMASFDRDEGFNRIRGCRPAAGLMS